MVAEPDLSLNAAVIRIDPKVGIVPDTLRGWRKQQRVDTGLTPGTTTDATKIKTIEQEVKELKRANEILLAASRFFARELDPRLPCTHQGDDVDGSTRRGSVCCSSGRRRSGASAMMCSALMAANSLGSIL